MKDGFICIDVACAHSPKVDQNKRFAQMVRISIMLDDGGG